MHSPPRGRPGFDFASFVALVVSGLLLTACDNSEHASPEAHKASHLATREPSPAEREALSAAAVASCKRAVANARTVSQVAKAELTFVCNKVVDRTGDLAPKLRKDVCREVEQASSSHSTSIRERARRDCEAEAAR